MCIATEPQMVSDYTHSHSTLPHLDSCTLHLSSTVRVIKLHVQMPSFKLSPTHTYCFLHIWRVNSAMCTNSVMSQRRTFLVVSDHVRTLAY